MPFNPNLTRSLCGRRPIEISDSRSQDAVTPLRQPSNTGKGVPRHGTRDPITPSSLPFRINPVYQPSPAQSGYTDPVTSGLLHFELPQSVLNHTPISVPGPMTGRSDAVNYTRIVPYSSAPPSITIESPDQQQQPLPAPSLAQSGRGLISPSTLAPFSQYPSGAGQQRNNTQEYPLPELEPLLLVEWDALVIARMERALDTSYIFRDSLKTALNRPNWKEFICPWPPRRTTVTGAGYDPKGGECIQLTLRNKSHQVVELPLAVIDREDMHSPEMGVQLVLCKDYLWKLNTGQTILMGIERQTGSMGHPDVYQWQRPGLPQNIINSAENLEYDYNSPTFFTSGNHMEGVEMNPQHLAPSFRKHDNFR
ncbi:hypothetical protein F4859DRAFT_517986 [Xylaria cf. heliscus]|nr:hypothetical protein F4859DRAFT_517986 [Xylaria cf. heliscus]